MNFPKRHLYFCKVGAFYFCLSWILKSFPLFAFPAAEVPPYIAQAWQTEDGLPHNAVQSIAQTADGYLWIGTHEGLARFDGVRFTIVDDSSASSPAKNSSVTALFSSPDGGLWIATEDGRAFRYEGGKFFELPFSQAGSGDYAMSIFESRDGSAWFGLATNGLVRWREGKADRWNQKNGLAHFSVRTICEDTQGRVWMGTGAGLNCWNNNRFEIYTIQDGLLHNSIRSVHADEGGNLWVGCHYGMTRWQGTNRVHFTKKEGLSDNIVTAILKDRSGQVWVGTFNGLNRIVGDKVITETHDGAPYDRVYCLLEDREGNIWAGTKDGLFRLKPRVVTAYIQQHGLTHSTATSVLEDRSGNLWVGFWGGGLNKIESNRVTAFTTREGLSSDWVLALHQSRRGFMWFGMDYDGGMSILRTNGFTHYRANEGLHDPGVRAFADDARTNLWVGTRTALLAFRDGDFRRFTVTNGLPGEIIEVIHEDAAGRLWVGTSGGLALFENEKWTSLPKETGGLPPFSISSLYEDKAGTFWLGTRGGGLCRMRRQETGDRRQEEKITFHVSRFTTKDGLFSDEISGIAEDDFGFLWMGSRRGIFRVNKSELENSSLSKNVNLTCLSFGKSDGMVSVECKGSGKTAAWKARDGRIWFPTSKGIVAVDPRQVRANMLPPPVVIAEVIADKRNVASDDWQVTRGSDLVTRHLSPVTLPPGRGELEFRYTALSYSAPEKVRFKYRLEGLDEDWVDAGNRREARYSHVPPGSYRFRVMAANSDGVWNEKESSLALTLTPPFWRTGWFLSLAALSFLGVMAGIVRYVSVKKLQAQLRDVEQQHAVEKERMRIAQDMHDELGARMTEIMLLSDLASKGNNLPAETRPQLKKLSNAARDVARNLDAIVWTVNPENDTLERVIGYIHEFAPTYLEAASIRCWFDFPDALPNLPMSSDVRHHLFSVVKESLNNIVKHSGATEVRLRLCIDNGSLLFAIVDNGKGFAAEDVSSFGNGLKNMKRRMSSVGAEFDLQSKPGDGTKTTIHILLNRLSR